MPLLTINGHHIHYRQQGVGPLLLILPGNTASSALHRGELEYFGQWYHAVSMDFWGTGLSERITGDWPADWFEQAGCDAAGLVEKLAEGPAVVMGTSGGAIAAWWMALQQPGTVRALVIDSEAPVFPPGWLERNMHNRNSEDPGAAAFWEAAHGADWRAVIRADTHFLLRYARTDHAAFMQRLLQIRLPVLLTASLQDDLLPPDLDSQLCQVARSIPGCQLFLHNGGSHPLMWSQPELFRTEALRFMADLA